MNGPQPVTIGGTRIEWLPAVGGGIKWVAVTLDVAEPSAASRICYTATMPAKYAATIPAVTT